MLTADHLTRRYGDVVAVDDVSFTVSKGEIVGLLGHNGAGKTTIMKLLTGFIEPSNGTATIDGVDIRNHTSEARSKLGYLPENRPLYTEMTVIEYLIFAARMRGLSEQNCQSCVREAIKSTDLGARAMDQIGTLSRGYQQRVGVAQAILHKPSVLILDEPTNGLDPSQTQHMRELIRRLSADATIILSTHIMQEVDAICDRALIMRDGKIVVDERLENLKRGKRIVLSTNDELEKIRRAVHQHASVSRNGEGIMLESRDDSSEFDVAALVRQLVAADVSIQSIAPERRDLEALFREVSEVSDAT